MTECYCMVCGESWDSFYDVKAHVYNKHTQTFPEASVGYREVTDD